MLTLDTRYRLVPSFGADAIRRFTSNPSDMKKLATCDFEDLLQVCGSSIRLPSGLFVMA